MITKKNLIAVLLALCISSIMFVALPTRSQTLPVYDPWADVSSPIIGQPDGVINMRDITYEILHFNSRGTPVDRAELLRTPEFSFDDNTEYVYPRSLHLNFTEIYILQQQTLMNATGMWGGWDTRRNNVTYTLSLNMAFFSTYASNINGFSLTLYFDNTYWLNVDNKYNPVQNITVNGRGCIECFTVYGLNNSVNWSDTTVFGNVEVAELST